MTRADFKKLAKLRLKDAKILLAAGQYDGAYYLAGYAVECALKACIIKKLRTSDSWPEKGFSFDCWKHDLNLLADLAGLRVAIENAGQVTKNWLIVKDWTENRRYEHGATKQTASDLYNAINDPANGVFQWLKARW
jgi:hypothetical protein